MFERKWYRSDNNQTSVGVSLTYNKNVWCVIFNIDNFIGLLQNLMPKHKLSDL